MRTLCLDQFSDLGGAQQCLIELLPAMLQKEWQILLGVPGCGGLVARAGEMGVPLRRISCAGYSAGEKSPADGLRFMGECPRLARQIRSLAREFRPDLLYVNGPRLLPAVTVANLRLPVVFHSHSVVTSRLARQLAGSCLRRLSARVVACCQFVEASWRSLVEPSAMSVVYNGVPGPRKYERRTPHVHQPLIGCIGRIDPQKGQLDFLNAARRIHAAIPNARFAIHGAPLFATREGVRYESELRKAAAGLPVEFRGWTPDIYRALAELDLLIVPSRGGEATTRVILEAFAAGVPVVARPSGGIPEVVEHGVDGLLANACEELAAGCVDLLKGPAAILAKMSERARQTWERRFTLERFRRELLYALAGSATGSCIYRGAS